MEGSGCDDDSKHEEEYSDGFHGYDEPLMLLLLQCVTHPSLRNLIREKVMKNGAVGFHRTLQQICPSSLSSMDK